MEPTEAELQSVNREVALEEAGSERSTAGTRTCSEAGYGRRAGWEQRSPIPSKTYLVEHGGAIGESTFLPGEISEPRGEEKSAEAVVVMKPANPGGAKGRRKEEGITGVQDWSCRHAKEVETPKAPGFKGAARQAPEAAWVCLGRWTRWCQSPSKR